MSVNNKLLVLICLLLVAGMASGQDFDADSVLYTPIPRVVETKPAPRKIFRDTVTNDQKFEYFFNVQSGAMIGCNDCDFSKEVTFSAATTHGVTIGRKLRTGIGVGFDSYFEWTTMPIFGSLSWDLLGTKNTQSLFVQATYGWSNAWIKKSEWIAGYTSVDGGTTASAQMGYRIKYHDIKIALAIGTKYQRLYRYYEYPSYYYLSDGTVVQGSPNTTTIKEELKRLVISLVVGWK